MVAKWDVWWADRLEYPMDAEGVEHWVGVKVVKMADGRV